MAVHVVRFDEWEERVTREIQFVAEREPYVG